MQSFRVHDPLDALMIYLLPLIAQFLVYSTDTITLLIVSKYLYDFFCKICISILYCIYLFKFEVIGGSCHFHYFLRDISVDVLFFEFFDDCCFPALRCAASFSSLKAISFL